MAWLNNQLWNYAEAEELVPMLDRDSRGGGGRPPVFEEQYAARNILIPPNAGDVAREKVIATVSKRHRHFGSMNSSQALAQSVFGNLIVGDNLDLLSGLKSDEGLPAFGADLSGAEVELEYEVDYLGEPRRTPVDVFIHGTRRIAVECKFTETEFGKCSRPKLKPEKNLNYARDYCDGSYTRQRGRKDRCSLSENGIQYWEYVPELFHWKSDCDLKPCPLHGTYQIVRNLLAACVIDGEVDTNAHALIIYDERNPTFHNNGKSRIQFDTARKALKESSLLRLCSWQAVVCELAKSEAVKWLALQLQNKYAFLTDKK